MNTYCAAGFVNVPNLPDFLQRCGYQFTPWNFARDDSNLIRLNEVVPVEVYTHQSPANAFYAKLLITRKQLRPDCNGILGAISHQSGLVNNFITNVQLNTNVRLIETAAPPAVVTWYMRSLEKELAKIFSRQ